MSDQVPNREIALNRLTISPLNVRKTDRKADIDALAASILSHGLLQNLNVVAREDDKYEVVAGGRRLSALKALVEAGAIAREFPVPCKVLPREQAREVSLAENVQRVDMDAIDEVNAYHELVQEGSSPEDIARRYGVTVRHVQQRLALANLSPRIKTAWKKGEVTLDAARAFCVADDHEQQDAVFRSLGKPVANAHAVRARLVDGRMLASDRLAVFVGLEAYEAAGGAIVRDLFDEDDVFVAEPALMTRLAEQKLETLCAEFDQAGWGWVETDLSGSPVSGMRIHPEWRDHTPEEEAELERLRADLSALDDALEADSTDNDPRWDQRDEIAGRIEAVRQEARVWDPDLKLLAGVVLSVTHAGELRATCGVVREADEKAVHDIRSAKDPDEADDDALETAKPATEPVPESGLPKSLIRDLSVARTRAVRLALMRSPEAALAVAVASMIARSTAGRALAGIGIVAHGVVIDDLDAARAASAAFESQLPEQGGELLAWCLKQPQAHLLNMLAMLTAQSVDLSHEKGTANDRAKQAMADDLCRVLAVDMRASWKADTEFWTRLPKSELLVALTAAPSVARMSTGKRSEHLKACGKLKKDELAVKVEAAYAKDHYLPDLFVSAPAAMPVAVEPPVLAG